MLSIGLMIAASSAASQHEVARECSHLNYQPNTVVRITDANGDGRDDVLWMDPPPRWYGEGKSTEVTALSGADGSVLWKIELPWGPCYGHNLFGLGDVNGDEVPDVCIGSATRLGVYSATDGKLIWSAEVHGVGREGADQSDDGVNEVLVLCPASGELESDFAQVQVQSGIDGKVLRTVTPQLDDDGKPLRLFCTRVFESVSDRNSDGVADFVLCDRSLAGEDHQLVFLDGKTLEELERKAVPRTSHPRSGKAHHPIDRFAEFDDLDGDGERDWLIAKVDTFAAVVSGKAGKVLKCWDYQAGYMRMEGTTLGSLGDLDGDGFGDFFIAQNENGLDCDKGLCELFSGKSLEVIRRYEPLARICGLDACVIGDQDGDGVRELVISEPFARRVYVVSTGKDGVLWDHQVAPGEWKQLEWGPKDRTR